MYVHPMMQQSDMRAPQFIGLIKSKSADSVALRRRLREGCLSAALGFDVVSAVTI